MELAIVIAIVAAVVGFIVYSRKRSRKGGAGDDRPGKPGGNQEK